MLQEIQTSRRLFTGFTVNKQRLMLWCQTEDGKFGTSDLQLLGDGDKLGLKLLAYLLWTPPQVLSYSSQLCRWSGSRAGLGADCCDYGHDSTSNSALQACGYIQPLGPQVAVLGTDLITDLDVLELVNAADAGRGVSIRSKPSVMCGTLHDCLVALIGGPLARLRQEVTPMPCVFC